MKRTQAITAGVLAALAIGTTMWFAPHWTVYRMSSAIKANDADAFSERVDFPALRESIKVQMMGLLKDNGSSPESNSNPLAGLGQMMVVALINPMIDAAVSPAGVIAMFKHGSAKPQMGASRSDAQDDADKANYTVAYRNWDTVTVRDESQKSGTFILKRAGLWSWKLSALELPAEVNVSGQLPKQ